MQGQENIARIKNLLKAHPKGFTITEIAQELDLNRNSAAKYLEILQISGYVESRSYGTAKVYFLTHRLPISALVTLASDLVVTLDENLRILFVNDRFCDFFAVKREDVSGKHIVDLFQNGVGHEVLPGIFSDVIVDTETVKDVHLAADTGEYYFRVRSMKTVFDDGSRGITIMMEDVTRQKQDQIALQETESRYRAIVEDQTEFIVRFLPDGKITFANASFSRFQGKRPEELPGTPCFDCCLEEDRRHLDQRIRSLSKKNPVTALECRAVLPAGETRWIAWTIRALPNNGDGIVEYQAVGQDITEKKEAAERIHRQVEEMEFFLRKLQQFIELPPGGDEIYRALAEGLSEILPGSVITVASYHPEMPAVTIRAVASGKGTESITREISRDLTGVTIGGRDLALLKEVMSGNLYNTRRGIHDLFFGQVPDEICRKIEEVLPSIDLYVIGLIWQGKLFGVLVFSVDKMREVTNAHLIETYARAASIALQRHVAEEALKKSEQLYRTVIENIQDVFYRTDPDGNLIMASPSAVSLLGYSSLDDKIGTDIADFYIDPEKRKEFLHAVTTKGSVSDYQVLLKKKDGSPLCISTNSHCYYDEDGTFLGVEGIFRDITEQKAAREKIRQHADEMEFLAQKLLDFVIIGSSEDIWSKIASDLRNLVPGAIVTVNSYDPHTGIITIRGLEMNERQHEAAVRILGKEPVGTGFPIDSGGLIQFRSGTLRHNTTSLYEILFRSVPEPVCRQLEAELDYGPVSVIGFVRSGEVLGNATIFMPKGEEIQNRRLVEMYARQASIALQRHIAEEDRRRSEEMFQNITENSPLPIALIEPDGTYRYINKSFTRLFGYDLSDFSTGREWFRLVFPDPESRRKAVETWKSDLARSHAGEPRSRTFPLQCRDGSVKEVIVSPVSLSDGRQCVVFEDITERKRAEQTHRLLSSIVESTGDAVIGKDRVGTIISWNRAAEHLYGYTAEEMIGRNISQIIPPEKTDEMEKIFRKIWKGETVRNQETKRVRKDGRSIDVSLTISPIAGDDGNVIGASTIARDITAEKAEERLRVSEENYRSLVENISVGIYRSTGDPKGRFVWGNSSLCRILGYPSLNKLKEVEVAGIFVEHDGRRKLLDDLKQQGFVKNREIALKRADGTTVNVLVTALARFDADGKLTCINGIVEDITVQRTAEDRVSHIFREVAGFLAIIPDPLVIIDAGNTVVAWNAAMEQLTGVPAADVMGKKDFERHLPFYDPARPSLTGLFCADDAILGQHYPGAYREGPAIIAPVRENARRNGRVRSFTIKAAPLTDSDGTRLGAMAIIRPAGTGGAGSLSDDSRQDGRGPDPGNVR